VWRLSIFVSILISYPPFAPSRSTPIAKRKGQERGAVGDHFIVPHSPSLTPYGCASLQDASQSRSRFAAARDTHSTDTCFKPRSAP
jgi:hypothetical protein